MLRGRTQAGRATGALAARRPFDMATCLLVAMVVLVAVLARVLSWPGFATHDTLFIADEAIRGVYTTYHPLLNALLVRLLVVPFGSFSVYTTLQIVFCAGLLLRALRFVADAEQSRWLAVWGALLWAVGISTVLYLGMIWKDVLVAYCLAYLCALAYWARRRGIARLGRVDVILVALALVLVVGLRHGMAFNLVAVPVLLGLRRFVSHRSFWGPWALSVAVLVGLWGASRSTWVDNDPVHLQRLRISAVSQPFLSIVSSPNGYTTDDPGYDAALASDVFGPRYAETFTADYFRNEIVPTDARTLEQAYRAILLRTPRLCALNIARCIAGRIEMALATLQPSTTYGGMRFYDLGLLGDCRTFVGVSQGGCAALEAYSRTERPVWLQQFAREFVARWVEPRGAVQNLLLWNLVPAALLLVGVLMFGRPSQALWSVTAFIALQMALPFATAMANDFRYYYFLSLYLAVFGPIVAIHVWRAAAERGMGGQVVAD